MEKEKKEVPGNFIEEQPDGTKVYHKTGTVTYPSAKALAEALKNDLSLDTQIKNHFIDRYVPVFFQSYVNIIGLSMIVD